MELDISVMNESCKKLFGKINKEIGDLGYVNLRVSYSQTEFENNQKGVIYVFVESSRLFYETKKERDAIRKIVPRSFEYGEIKSSVKVEFAKLPSGIAKRLSAMRKLRTEK